MRSLYHKVLFFSVFLMLSSVVQAADNPQVRQWTKNILLQTLSVDYRYKDKNNDKLSKGFTHNSWNAISDFLGGYMQTIRTQQLIINPEFIEEPTIVQSGIVSGIRYWRVNEILSLPELRITVAFSLVVIATTPSTHGSFVIQSMDMVKQDN